MKAGMMSTSVVIPTKNSVKTIEKCLSSLMPYYEQGYVKEIIVVDGHSSDGTLDVVKRYPVKLLFEKKKGIYIACETGWRNARGELVLFIDSDAWLGDGFYPKILEFFQVDEMGIVGAEAQVVISNRLSRIIAEWNAYHSDKIRKIQSNSSLSWFERLYRKILWFGDPQVTVTGPCFVVRRSSLEAVGGIHTYPRYDGSEDSNLSRKIMETGRKATWWLGAPVYHYPRPSLMKLERQSFYLHGVANALTDKHCYKTSRRTMALLKLLGAPVFGLICTLRFKNPLHLLLFTLTKYTMLAGYLYGLVLHRKPRPGDGE